MSARGLLRALFCTLRIRRHCPHRQIGPGETCTPPCYPKTSTETAQSITPVNTASPPGNVRRYGALGDGTANDTQAIETRDYVMAKCTTVVATTGTGRARWRRWNSERADRELFVAGVRQFHEFVEPRHHELQHHSWTGLLERYLARRVYPLSVATWSIYGNVHYDWIRRCGRVRKY